MSQTAGEGPARAPRRIGVSLAALLALATTTAILAVAAWYLDSPRTEMLVAMAGSATAIAALVASYAQIRQRAAHRALHRVEAHTLRDMEQRTRAETLLAQSDARLRAIVDSAMDAIITIDDGQDVVLFNRAAEAMFGCAAGDAIGAPLGSLIPTHLRGAHADHVRHFAATGTSSRRMSAQRVVAGLRRNGEEFPIEASISQSSEHGRKFYTVILRDVTERVRAEVALRASKEELQELGVAAQQALEQEKSRVARELHDELAQALTALQMDLVWCQEKGDADREATLQRLERMQWLLDKTVAATRRIAADLRPLMLDDLGLVPAVEWLVENFTQRHGVACELAVSSPELALPDTHATAAFRIVQESLTNIAKHARASRVEVAIRHHDSDLIISVRDDGRGFSPRDPRKPNSYGLLGLRERASLLGGEASVTSGPGQGTRIEVRIPLPQGANGS